MTDEFKSLKGLGKTISKKPTQGMIQHWTQASMRLPRYRRSQWLQLAAALVAGVLIGKYMLQPSPNTFPASVKNNISTDETFEYSYTNN